MRATNIPPMPIVIATMKPATNPILARNAPESTAVFSNPCRCLACCSAIEKIRSADPGRTCSYCANSSAGGTGPERISVLVPWITCKTLSAVLSATASAAFVSSRPAGLPLLLLADTESRLRLGERTHCTAEICGDREPVAPSSVYIGLFFARRLIVLSKRIAKVEQSTGALGNGGACEQKWRVITHCLKSSKNQRAGSIEMASHRASRLLPASAVYQSPRLGEGPDFSQERDFRHFCECQDPTGGN